MPNQNRHRSRRLVALVALFAVVAVACGSGDDDEPSANGSTTTTTAADGSTPPTDLGGATTATTAAGDAPPVTVGDTPAAEPGDAQPVKNQYGAPFPGAYQYGQGSSSSPTRIDIFDLAEEPARADRATDLRQLEIYTHPRGERQDSYRIRYGADGRYVQGEQARTPDGGEGAICIWEPEYLDLPWPLTVGAEWSWDSSCTAEDVERRRFGSAKITGTEKVDVKGRVVDVFVIERRQESVAKSDDFALDVTQVIDVVQKWSPELGLLVSEEGTSQDTLQGAPRDARNVRRVLLDPQAYGQG